jgi:hypothetical protein
MIAFSKLCRNLVFGSDNQRLFFWIKVNISPLCCYWIIIAVIFLTFCPFLFPFLFSFLAKNSYRNSDTQKTTPKIADSDKNHTRPHKPHRKDGEEESRCACPTIDRKHSKASSSKSFSACGWSWKRPGCKFAFDALQNSSESKTFCVVVLQERGLCVTSYTLSQNIHTHTHHLWTLSRRSQIFYYFEVLFVMNRWPFSPHEGERVNLLFFAFSFSSYQYLLLKISWGRCV